VSPLGRSEILQRRRVGGRWRDGAVGGAATTGTWQIVGCFVRPSNVRHLCQYCLGPECIGFQILNSFPYANRHDDYFSATPVSG
jgi:hypothetical protein